MASTITSEQLNEYPHFHGRKVIHTHVRKITEDNVLYELSKAMSVHTFNSAQIKYLYNYYKGKQSIKNRKKEVRPEIQNNIVENTAYEIVSFKSSYLLGEPCTYTRRGDGENVSDDISMINDYMYIKDKASQDKIMADWLHIGGLAYRMILPATKEEQLIDGCPFIIDVLNPKNTFCVYNSGFGTPKVMGVTYCYDEKNSEIYTVYTPERVFTIQYGQIVSNDPNPLGCIPIIEYKANTAIMGAFEPVLDLLDALNTIASNRVDDIEQIVQAYLKFIGAEVTEEQMEFMAENHLIMLPNGTDASYITAPLDQQQSQTLVDYCYGRILTICGMPATQNGGASTSDTGVAVMFRDGWQQAEANASDTELFFKRSEKQMLQIMLRILKDTEGLDINLADIDIKFTRRQYEASLTKAETLQMMLNCGVEPKVAFPICGLFYDPTDAYEQSKELLDAKWGKENYESTKEDTTQADTLSTLQQTTNDTDNGDIDSGDKVSEV